LVGHDCGFDQDRSTQAERKEMLDNLWIFNKDWFFVGYKQLQERYTIESRRYESQVNQYFLSKKHRTLGDLLIQLRFSVNTVVPTTELLMSPTLYYEELFKAIVDGKKRICLIEKDAIRHLKERLTEIVDMSKRNRSIEGFFYQTGRLFGFMFQDQSPDYDFYGIEQLQLYHRLYFRIGYLEQVPNNHFLEEQLFSEIHSQLATGDIKSDYASHSLMNQILLRIAQLGVSRRADRHLSL
jgi:hypothetical protein